MSYLDTRDLAKRLEELTDLQSDPDYEFDGDEANELDELQEMEANISDWLYGETLIPDYEFEDYARDFARDIGAIEDDGRWPTTHIDWERAANDLKQDYVEVEYEGTTYLARA